ncbi:MAG: HAD-IA family hydrolase [Anaerolineae bacterium]|nr:HAD-IA family hydrolase [Anaerolineae bacterium]
MTDDNKKKLRTSVVCLDMADTLVYAAPHWYEAAYRIYGEAGIQATTEELKRAIYRGFRDSSPKPEPLTYPATEEYHRAKDLAVQVRILQTLGYDDPALAEQIRRAWVRVSTDPANYVLFPDVLPTLATLRERGYRLGIISNWSWELPDLVEGLGLSPYFEVVTVSARAGASKPHPAIFQQALARFGVPPENVLHVGDNPEADAEGARSIGITGVLLDREGGHAANHYPVIRRLTELPDLLGRLAL